MGGGKKDTIVLANHSKHEMPKIKTRLKRRGFEVFVSANLVDTLSCIRKEAPNIIVLKPSSLPIPEYESSLIYEASKQNQKVLLVLSTERELKKVTLNGSHMNDFYMGDSPTELMVRIELIASRILQDRKLNQELEQLQAQSITDYKTGLYNDRFIFRRLVEEYQRSDRHGTVLSIIMIDLDGFKQLNDSKGHPFGDFVLQTFSQKLCELIRKIDLPGRYGGDEFLVLLPNTGLDEAASIAGRLRAFWDDHTFEKDGQRAKISISQGVNTYSGDGRITCDELLKGADEAVLEAKKKGKNRVCLYPLMNKS